MVSTFADVVHTVRACNEATAPSTITGSKMSVTGDANGITHYTCDRTYSMFIKYNVFITLTTLQACQLLATAPALRIT